MSLSLRPYQVESVEQLRQGLRAGHKHQLLVAPTGAGKTVIATHLMQEANAKMSRATFLVDRVSLVDQTSRMFDTYEIPHGVLQGNHFRFRPWERITIASAQTLHRRGFPEGTQLLIVDEAHTLYKTTVDFINAHENLPIIGLTATAFTKGLGKIYSNLVNVTTTNKLIDEGFLAPLRAYAAKKIDMAGARTKNDGEWNDEDVSSRAMVIVGDVVECWIEKTMQHFGGPVKTLLFSASVAHGEELCRKFQSLGYNFQQISYKDSDDKRRAELINEFRKDDSEIVGLVSVEALAKGFDVPSVHCGVCCRPYRKSLSGHIQQIGRVMRPYPGKEFALWIDHAGNFLRFMEDTGQFFEDGIHDLNDSELDSKVRKEPEDQDFSSKCGGCGYILSKADIVCPSCGWARPRKQNLLQHLPGELQEVGMKKKEVPAWLQDKELVWRQICHEGLRRKKGDFETAERWAKAQYKNLFDAWPRYAMRNITPEEPCYELSRKLQSMMIKWAKGKARAA